MKVAQSYPTLCSSTDCIPPGFFVLGILQVIILEWVAVFLSRGSFDPGIKPRSPALQADSLPSELSRLMSKLKIDFYLKHIDKFLQGIY